MQTSQIIGLVVLAVALIIVILVFTVPWYRNRRVARGITDIAMAAGDFEPTLPVDEGKKFGIKRIEIIVETQDPVSARPFTLVAECAVDGEATLLISQWFEPPGPALVVPSAVPRDLGIRLEIEHVQALNVIAQSLVMQPEVAAEAFRMRIPMSLIITDKNGVEFLIALGQWLMIKETGEIFKMQDSEFRETFLPTISLESDPPLRRSSLPPRPLRGITDDS